MDGLRILFVDDDEMIRWAMGEFFQRRDYAYALAGSGPEALGMLHDRDFDVLLTDLAMPEMYGLDLVRQARELRPQIVPMVLTGLRNREDVVRAIKEGVFDIIDKPVQDYSEFSLAIERAGLQARLVRERDTLLDDLQHKNQTLEISLGQLNKAYAQLCLQEERLEEDLRQAQRIHQRLLPKRFPDIQGMSFYGYFSPCERLGGDFFDVLPLSGERNRVGLYLADVAGHGVGAAMITVIVRELIHAHMMLNPSSDLFEKPSETLKFINQGILEENFDPPILVTMAYAVVDVALGNVEIACAGHPEPMLVTARDHYTFVPASGPVLGILTDIPYSVARFQLDQGDYFLLYSDGISDARNEKGEVLGDEQMGHTVAHAHGRRIAQIGRSLENLLKKHQGTVAIEDDETFLLVGRMAYGKVSRDASHSASPERSVHIVHQKPNAANQRARISAGVEVGWSDNICVMALTGKATWRQAKLLRKTAREAEKQEACTIYLDLRRCQYMDSTLLGVLYQNAENWRLYGAQPVLVRLFEELGILNRLRFAEMPVPEVQMHAVESEASPVPDSEILLSAHEALISASEENRHRFGQVVELMRRQIEERP